MKTASKIIADKFAELVRAKWYAQGQISGFTHAERVLWLLVTIRCEIDMDGFVSLFDQALSRIELVETLSHLREIDLREIAELFEQALALLDANKFYSQDGNPIMSSWNLAQQQRDELDAIGQKIAKDDVLWSIDQTLVDMLNMDNIAEK